MGRRFIGGLLFACSCGNAAEPEMPGAPRSDVCKARAEARFAAERADAAPSEPVAFRGAEAVDEAIQERLIDCRGWDLKLDACVIMQARVTSAGAVASSEPYVNDGVPEDVIYCLSDVLRTARFAGGERSERLLIPITFVPRRRWAR